MMSANPMPIPAPTAPQTDEEPLVVTLGELVEVLSEVTDDDDELAATLLHMVEGGRVRLIEERVETY